MSLFAIEREGSLVNQIVFKGSGLYRETAVVPLTFSTLKAAEEVAEVLDATVVAYSNI